MDRHKLAAPPRQSFDDHCGNQLLGEMIGPVVVGAVGEQGRQLIGLAPGAYKMQLSIDGDDWMFQRGYELKHVPPQIPAEVHWSVQYICGGTPELIDRGNGMTEYRYVLGSGLANAGHTAELSSPPNDLAAGVELRAYRPPLREN